MRSGSPESGNHDRLATQLMHVSRFLHLGAAQSYPTAPVWSVQEPVSRVYMSSGCIIGTVPLRCCGAESETQHGLFRHVPVAIVETLAKPSLPCASLPVEIGTSWLVLFSVHY